MDWKTEKTRARPSRIVSGKVLKKKNGTPEHPFLCKSPSFHLVDSLGWSPPPSASLLWNPSSRLVVILLTNKHINNLDLHIKVPSSIFKPDSFFKVKFQEHLDGRLRRWPSTFFHVSLRSTQSQQSISIRGPNIRKPLFSSSKTQTWAHNSRGRALVSAAFRRWIATHATQALQGLIFSKISIDNKRTQQLTLSFWIYRLSFNWF